MIVSSGLGTTMPAPVCAWYQEPKNGACAISPMSIFDAPAALVSKYAPTAYSAGSQFAGGYMPMLVSGAAWLLLASFLFSGSRGRR